MWTAVKTPKAISLPYAPSAMMIFIAKRQGVKAAFDA
jgi:hypothetical protein